MHHLGDVQYFPLALPFFVLLAGALLLLLALVQIQVLRYAYLQLGVSPEAALLLLAGSLFGSYVNIPIAVLGDETMVAEGQVTYFGMRYVVPKIVSQDVILAVNVGGAIIPTLLSIYLLSRNLLWEPGLIAIACVAAVCNHFAEPVRGIGIAIPIFLAPLAAVTTAAVVPWRDIPVLSYVAGSLGVLIGADILNLDKIRGLGTPVA